MYIYLLDKNSNKPKFINSFLIFTKPVDIISSNLSFKKGGHAWFTSVPTKQNWKLIFPLWFFIKVTIYAAETNKKISEFTAFPYIEEQCLLAHCFSDKVKREPMRKAMTISKWAVIWKVDIFLGKMINGSPNLRWDIIYCYSLIHPVDINMQIPVFIHQYTNTVVYCRNNQSFNCCQKSELQRCESRDQAWISNLNRDLRIGFILIRYSVPSSDQALILKF